MASEKVPYTHTLHGRCHCLPAPPPNVEIIPQHLVATLSPIPVEVAVAP